MRSHSATTNPAPDHSDRSLPERNDVNVKGIVVFLVGLVLFGVLLHLALGGLNVLCNRRNEAAGKSMTTVRASPHMAPPAPQLQVAPREDLTTFREHEDDRLNSYGWINRTAGVVRIPISRAMELLVQRGLPTNNATAPKTPYDLIKERAAQR